jgi:hypothetical protein
MGAVNAETNDAICITARMLHEAADLNDWFTIHFPSTSGEGAGAPSRG